MTESLWFITLTQHVVEDYQSSKVLHFPESYSVKVKSYVEHLLLNKSHLLEHIWVLNKLYHGGNFDFVNKPSSAITNKILQYGLEPLTIHELAKLIINPIALMSLSYEIANTEESFWASKRSPSNHKPKFCI